MAELQVRVAADVASAITALQKLEKEFDRAKLGAEETAKGADAASRSLSKLPNSAGQATMSVTNLGRVVQDLPYGFIGIQNNISPLFESFTQLKNSTGSVGGALSALGKSLIGPAGIGLAISAITAGINFAINGFSAWRARVQQAKTVNDEFKKSLDGAQASALSTGLQLQQFVDIAKNGNLPLSQRNEALSQANKLLGQYGEKLTLANVATQQATILINKYTQGLIAQALANQYADRAATLLIQQTNAQKALTEAQIEYNKAQAAFINRPLLSTREQELGRGQAYIIQRDQALKKLNERQLEYSNITTQVTDITKQFNEQALKSTKLLGGAGQKIKGGKLDAQFEVAFEISNRSELEAKLAGGLPSLLPELNDAIKNIQTDPKDIKVPFKINLSADAEVYQKWVQENGKYADAAIEAVQDFILSSSVEAFSTLGTALGTALAGGNVGDVFKSFAEEIGDGLQALGKKIIMASPIIAALRKALSSLNPVLMLPAGIALVALGAALKASVNKGVSARATGGPVSGGNPYLIGERGPELFVPSVSGSIVPNNQVGSFMGGRMMGGGGTGSILRGQDIILAYARTQRSQLRVNG